MRKQIAVEPVILYKLTLWGGLTALFFGCYFSQAAVIFGQKSVESLLILAYGYLDIQGIRFIIPLLFWLLPLIFLLYFLGDYISGNLGRNAVYIFTRTDRRTQWLLARVVNLLLYVLFYYCFQIGIVCILAGILGFKMANWQRWSAMALSITALSVLANYMIILVVNLLSLLTSSIFSSTITLVANLACLFIAEPLFKMGQSGIIKWLPFIQGIFSWHSGISGLIGRSPFLSFQVPGCSIAFSLVYLTGIILVLVGWGVVRIKNMDLL